MLSHEAVIEWKAIYERETGLDITFEEATTQANRMFNFLTTVTNQRYGKKLQTIKGGEKNDKKAHCKKVRKH